MNAHKENFATAEALRNISVQDFQNFGIELIAYVRPVTVRDQKAYGLYAADGRLLTLQDTGALATLAARHNGLETVTVH